MHDILHGKGLIIFFPVNVSSSGEQDDKSCSMFDARRVRRLSHDFCHGILLWLMRAKLAMLLLLLSWNQSHGYGIKAMGVRFVEFNRSIGNDFTKKKTSMKMYEYLHAL